MSRTRNSTIDMILTGMFAAVLAVLSQIQIPMPSGVPVTLQTFAIALTGFVLGCRRGLITVAVYVLLGAIGLPVFTGFMGGFGKMTGPTGGFIWGFLFLVAACGIGGRKKSAWQGIAIAGVGLMLCHMMGIFQFKILSEMELTEAALLISVPYIGKDILSLAAGWLLARMVRIRLGKVGIMIT